MKIAILPSTLFISSDTAQIDVYINQLCQQLENKISLNNPDIFIINQNTGWTIDLARQIKNFISQKPFNHPNKIVIIYQADNLNIESQNAPQNHRRPRSQQLYYYYYRQTLKNFAHHYLPLSFYQA